MSLRSVGVRADLHFSRFDQQAAHFSSSLATGHVQQGLALVAERDYCMWRMAFGTSKFAFANLFCFTQLIYLLCQSPARIIKDRVPLLVLMKHGVVFGFTPIILSNLFVKDLLHMFAAMKSIIFDTFDW